MSEQVTGHESLNAAMQTTSYEEMRESARGEAGLAWKLADREANRLQETYRQLRDDPRYSEEYKQEAAWRAYETASEQIQKNRENARLLLEQQARSAEQSSIPVPGGEAITTKDVSRLLASQNEAARLVRQVERVRSQGSSGGPFKPDATSILREEYGRALQLGGVEGGCLVRGVLSAARELGITTDAVVDSYRKERHHEALERARYSERLMQSISKRVPEPPFRKSGSPLRGSLPREGGANVFQNPHAQTVSNGAGGVTGKRKPSWK